MRPREGVVVAGASVVVVVIVRQGRLMLTSITESSEEHWRCTRWHRIRIFRKQTQESREPKNRPTWEGRARRAILLVLFFSVPPHLLYRLFRGVARGGVRGVRTPPPPKSGEGGGPVQRQEEGGAKSMQEGPKLPIFLALRANNTSEITIILLKMVQFFSKTRIFSRFARYYPHEQD